MGTRGRNTPGSRLGEELQPLSPKSRPTPEGHKRQDQQNRPQLSAPERQRDRRASGPPSPQPAADSAFASRPQTEARRPGSPSALGCGHLRPTTRGSAAPAPEVLKVR